MTYSRWEPATHYKYFLRAERPLKMQIWPNFNIVELSYPLSFVDQGQILRATVHPCYALPCNSPGVDTCILWPSRSFLIAKHNVVMLSETIDNRRFSSLYLLTTLHDIQRCYSQKCFITDLFFFSNTTDKMHTFSWLFRTNIQFHDFSESVGNP